MRSCPARGHGNQGDDELSRIWACKSRRCRPPQTGVPATRENIAASTTHHGQREDAHPQLSLYPSGALQPCPVQGWRSPTHPLDPDLVRRSWSQNCKFTQRLSILLSWRHEASSRIAQLSRAAVFIVHDFKLTACEFGGRDGLREPQLASLALVWPPGISLRKPLNLGAEPSVDIGLGMSAVKGERGHCPADE